MGSAKIDSPEILKDFRYQIIKFNESCQQALAGVKSDVYCVQRWLESEQLSRWKQELQKCEERVIQARHVYNEARFSAPALRKTSYFDEQKALRKAEYRREEVLEKISKVKKWASMLQQQSEKMMGPLGQLSQSLETQSPKALARLDSMIQSLEEYLRLAPPDSGIK